MEISDILNPSNSGPSGQFAPVVHHSNPASMSKLLSSSCSNLGARAEVGHAEGLAVEHPPVLRGGQLPQGDGLPGQDCEERSRGGETGRQGAWGGAGGDRDGDGPRNAKMIIIFAESNIGAAKVY